MNTSACTHASNEHSMLKTEIESESTQRLEASCWQRLEDSIMQGNDEEAFQILCALNEKDFPVTWGFDDLVANNMMKSTYVYYLRSSCPKLDLFKALCFNQTPKFVRTATCIIENVHDPTLFLKGAMWVGNSKVVHKVLSRGKIQIDIRVIAHLAAQTDSATCLEKVLQFTPQDLLTQTAAFSLVTMVSMSKGHLLKEMINSGIQSIDEKVVLNARATMKAMNLPVLSGSERFFVAQIHRNYFQFVYGKQTVG